jgi:hypothetical protein
VDDPRLLPLAKGINEHERANAEPLDKAVLTLSGAALALSLTFSKDIAPPDRAVWLWLLFVSWGLFVLSIAINIAGYLTALTFFRREWKLSMAALRHKTRPESDLRR